VSAVFFGRDIIPLATVQRPRAAFLAGGDPFAGADGTKADGVKTSVKADSAKSDHTDADDTRPELSVVRDAG
jgi:NADH:ubiquinone reductase (H+-translocating)